MCTDREMMYAAMKKQRGEDPRITYTNAQKPAAAAAEVGASPVPHFSAITGFSVRVLFAAGG